MQRVEAAINEGRCVVAIGGRALDNSEVLAELRRRSLPAVALGGTAVSPTATLSAESLAPVLGNQGGVLVLVEPDGASDGMALGELARLIKAGSHRPKLYIAARAFNPFGLPMAMRLMKMEQLKLRAADFISQLPLEARAPVRASTRKEKRRAEQERIAAPRPLFVGREEECAALVEMLGREGGPVVLAGEPGSGRRWLMEHSLAQTELERLPDFCFGHGTELDSFIGVLAMICREAGDERLHERISQPHQRPPAHELAGILLESLQAEALANKVWVVDGLDSLRDRRDGSFYRDDALSTVLRAILTGQSALKFIFMCKTPPTFYREGEAGNLQVLRLAGLKGKELHELFEAWHVPEFPRDRFGSIVERTHGHPVACRYLGVAVREEGDVDALLKQPKFLKAKDIADVEPLGRHIKRRVAELDDAARIALSTAALFRTPAAATDLQAMGINRVQRLNLLARGLLEQTPLQDDRRFYVHPLVGRHLVPREVLDFDRLAMLGRHFLERSKAEKNAGSLARSLSLAFDANRLLSMSRNGRSRVVLPYPDNDPLIEDIREILQRKSPRFDIARMRLKEAQKADSRNPRLYQIEVELCQLEGKKDFDPAPIWNKAIAECPVPDLFHAQATLASRRSARGKAATALEEGVKLFPANARLRRRLASVQLSQNRVEDARDTLKAAQDLEPMMPDTYSQLAEVYMRLGLEHMDDAKASLDEALRLDPEGAHHHARQGEMHRLHAMADPDQRETLMEAAEACLTEASRMDPNSVRIQVSLATVLIDREGDLEQAQWLVNRALKRHQTADGLVQHVRILIRQGILDEVERLLDRASKKEPSNHAAFAARSEYWMAQGQVFHAFEALKTARERSPKGCAERHIYEARMRQLGALIESGQAAQLLKAQGAAEETGADEAVEGSGPRRDAGTTTRLRKAKSGATESEATQAEAAQSEAIEPEETEPEAVESEAVEPEATEPEAVEPEATEPEAVTDETTEAEAVSVPDEEKEEA